MDSDIQKEIMAHFTPKRKENDMDKAIEMVLQETVADFLEDIDILRERAGAENQADFDKLLKKLMKGVK